MEPYATEEDIADFFGLDYDKKRQNITRRILQSLLSLTNIKIIKGPDKWSDPYLLFQLILCPQNLCKPTELQLEFDGAVQP